MINNIQSKSIEYTEKSDYFIDTKYGFLTYCIEQLEDLDIEEIKICLGSSLKHNAAIDALYYNADENIMNLYIVDFVKYPNRDIYLKKSDFLNGLETLKNTVEIALNGKFRNLEESSDMYDSCDLIQSYRKECIIVLNYVTNKMNESIRENTIEIGLTNVDAQLRIYDYNYISNCIKGNLLDNKIILDSSAKDKIYALRISKSDDFDVYLTYFKGDWLAKLYKEDSVRLLEANVRSYLKKTSKVNKGIMDTLKFSPEEFVSYNNGLATVVTDLDADVIQGENVLLKSLTNFQIVNGGQTTATLYEALRDNVDLSNIVVPTKMTLIKNKEHAHELINNISVYSNTQTAIKRSDPPSNYKFYVDIEKTSNLTWANSEGNQFMWFFERTNGQYNTARRRANYSKAFDKKYPKNRKFTKLELAKAVAAWMQLPDQVSLGNERNFEEVTRIVKNQDINVSEYYYKNIVGALLLFKEIDSFIRKANLKSKKGLIDKPYISYKGNVVTYTMSYISYLTSKKLDLVELFEKQNLPEWLHNIVSELVYLVHENLTTSNPSMAEIRMWARKRDCWNSLLDLNLNIDFNVHNNEVFNFYEENKHETFIMKNENLRDNAIWTNILLWNVKSSKLTAKQINMVKTMKNMKPTRKNLTKKQKEFAIDIFLHATNNGFEYEGSTM